MKAAMKPTFLPVLFLLACRKDLDDTGKGPPPPDSDSQTLDESEPPDSEPPALLRA
jgi:hypothetical protein